MTDAPETQVGKVIETLFNDNWPKRRRLLYATLAFDMIAIGWILYRGSDTQVFVQLGIALIAQATALLTAYIFGAVWDDHNKRARLRVQPGPSEAPEYDESRRHESEDENTRDHEGEPEYKPEVLK